jgi:hypothetical protein
METVCIFTNKELSKLDIHSLEKIKNESTSYLEGLNNISGKITERAYNLIGLAIAVYSLLTGIVSCFSSSTVLLIIMLIGFSITVFFMIKVIKTYKSYLPGMTPEQIKKHLQWNAPDLNIDLLLLSIYNNNNKIKFTQERNTIRIKYYFISLYSLLATCLIVTISIVLS